MPVPMISATEATWPAHLAPIPRVPRVSKLRSLVRHRMAQHAPLSSRTRAALRPRDLDKRPPGWWWKRCEVSWDDVWRGREQEAILIAGAEREAEALRWSRRIMRSA